MSDFAEGGIIRHESSGSDEVPLFLSQCVYGNGGYLPRGLVRVPLSPGEKIIDRDGRIVAVVADATPQGDDGGT